ncbi:hypothetical protein D3C73_1230990 [compost metagenome]
MARVADPHILDPVLAIAAALHCHRPRPGLAQVDHRDARFVRRHPIDQGCCVRRQAGATGVRIEIPQTGVKGRAAHIGAAGARP